LCSESPLQAAQQQPALAQRVHGLVEGEVAAGQHQHAIAERIDLLHDVRGQDHRGLPGEFADQPAHVFVLLRVQAVARLVEDQQLRLTENGLGHADALLETATQVADRVEQRAPSSVASTLRRMARRACPVPRRPFRCAA
jgi:hypothetical protein